MWDVGVEKMDVELDCNDYHLLFNAAVLYVCWMNFPSFLFIGGTCSVSCQKCNGVTCQNAINADRSDELYDRRVIV